jgi:hypothetical protein
MEQDLEELVARASDPRWIAAIYNYCDRRCARCRFSTMIGPKIHRAIAGQNESTLLEDHPTQNDSHGSAKIARLMIADSSTAWRVVNETRAPNPEPNVNTNGER